MFSFFKNLFKRKPKKEIHCAQCNRLIDDKEHVFVFDFGKVVTHAYKNCVWGWLKANNRNARNLPSVLLKKVKKSLP